MARPRIEGPTPQKGDVFALYHKGAPEGRRIKIETVGAHDVEVRTVGGRDATTCISLSALRPTANGWHLVERDGREAIVSEDGKVILGGQVNL